MNREQESIAEQIKSLLELLPLISKIEQQIIDHPRDMNLLTDTAFLCRKSEEILQAVRKSLNTLSDAAEMQASYMFEVMEERRYSNQNATITPNPKLYVKYPTSPNEPGYVEFVKQLPPDAVRPHYPTVTELICKEAENGGQLPFGLKEENLASISLKLRVTSKRDL